MERRVTDREKAIMDAYLNGKINSEEAGGAIALIRESQQSGYVASTAGEIEASGQALVEALVNPTLFPTQPDERINEIRVDAAQVVNILASSLLTSATPVSSSPNLPDSQPASSALEVRVSRRWFLTKTGRLVTFFGLSSMMAATPAAVIIKSQPKIQKLESLLAEPERSDPNNDISELRDPEGYNAHQGGQDKLQTVRERLTRLREGIILSTAIMSAGILYVAASLRGEARDLTKQP